MHRFTELLLQVMYAARRAGARARNAAVAAHTYAWARHVRRVDNKRQFYDRARDEMIERAARFTRESAAVRDAAVRNVAAHGGEFDK